MSEHVEQAEEPTKRHPLPWRSGLVTIALIAVNVAVYLAELANPSTVMNSLGQIGTRVHAGEYYRLLTSMFVHLPPPQVWHIIGNMLWLALLGLVLERILGHLRFALLYLMCGLAGSALAYLILDPNQVGVGASGVIFGLLGGAVTVVKRTQQHWLYWVVLLLIGLNSTFFASSYINWSAHVGGLVMGLILTPLLVYPPRNRRLVAGALGCAVGVLGMIGMIGMIGVRASDLTDQLNSLNGVYDLVGRRTRCSGSFAGCGGDQQFRSQWRVRDCGTGSCTIISTVWAENLVLTGSDGHWAGVATRKPEFSAKCQGEPIDTTENVEITQGASQEGELGQTPTLEGTMKSVSPRNKCKMGIVTWSFTATRTRL